MVGVQERDRRVYLASELSDGLLLFIGLSTAAALGGDPSAPKGPRLLAIEEPERGIHPRRIRSVIDYLRRLADHETQVVISSHSPLVLDEFAETPEDVLLFDRGPAGTSIKRLTEVAGWEALVGGAPLGDVWYSGVLGGVPR